MKRVRQKNIYSLLAVLVFAACAGGVSHVSYPSVLTLEARKAWSDAESSYLAKRYGDANILFERFINSFGYNELTDEARFRRGEISFLSQNYNDAISFYRSAYANIYSPSIAPKAEFKAAYSLYKLQRFDEAAGELSKIKRANASALLRTRADSLGVIISRNSGDSASAMRFLLYILDDYADLGLEAQTAGISDLISEKEARDSVRRWVQNDKVSSDEISRLPLNDYKGKLSGGYALFKYGKALNMEGLSSRAQKELKSYAAMYPKHEYYEAAKAMLGEASLRAGSASVKIGLILPLSGKYAIYGESVLHGIECAAGVFDPCESDMNVALVVRDVDGQAEKIQEAISELNGEGVIAIIGPILSSTVDVASEGAQRTQIPMITLSQREKITNTGEFIFRNTVSARSQVDSVVDFAVGKKHLKQFLVLYPKNAQGEEYNNVFAERVMSAGGRIVKAYGYSENRVEFASELISLPILSEENRKFSAIFIPDAFGAVGYIATTLGMMGIEGVPMFGISRWDDPRLVSLGGKYVEGAVFPDAFFARSDNPEVSNFITKFKQAYNIEPTLLEALGYDSLKMILETVHNGAAHRITVRDALMNLHDFNGVTGRISFDENRDTKRVVPLLTVSDGEIRPLSY